MLSGKALDALKLVLVTPILTVIAYLIHNEIARYRTRIKGLPGPVGIPVVGSLLQVRYRSFSSGHPSPC